eukprot:jgi/Ulvmu1/8803/UM048_0058.1
MPAKRRGKAVTIPSSPAFSFAMSHRPKPASRDVPGPGTYNVHGDAQAALDSKGQRTVKRAQIDQRGNVLTKQGMHPHGGMRSAPAYSIASKPFSSAMLTKTPGPGEYNDHKCLTGPKAPAYTFTGAEPSDPNAKLPGPGKYKWAQADAKIRPHSPAVTMKFRRSMPEDKTRRPAPNEYNPRDPLQIYKGEYTKVTIKLRRKPKMIEILPEPGPGEYSPGDATLHRSPAYTVRDKLASQLDPPPYPGPGHYDVEESTIGNWGGGMAAHVPEQPDLNLRERIDVFRRGATAATDQQFLNDNRRELLEMRAQQLRGGSAGSRPPGSGRRKGTGSKAARGAGGDSSGFPLGSVSAKSLVYVDT